VFVGWFASTPERGRCSVRAAVVALGLMLVGGALTSCSVSGGAGQMTVQSCTEAARLAKCGILHVYENRPSASGRTIPIRFVVIPALVSQPARDPVVWFAGGPGDSAVSDISNELPLLSEFNSQHDIVFIEQRGTGGPSALSCPAFPSLKDKSLLRSAVQRCLHQLPGDLRYYTTEMFVDDVAQVLRSLHYPKADLVGISYGAAAEQAFALRHPDQVRTMTLLSGSPVNLPVYEYFPENAQAALDHLIGRCEVDPACGSAFPHLEADWTALWSSIRTAPWTVPADRSPTHRPIKLTSDTLANLVHQLLMSARTAAQVPVLIHSLEGTTDHAVALAGVSKALTAAGESIQALLGGAPSVISYPIRCDESWGRSDPTTLSNQQSSFEYRVDVEVAQWWQYFCTLLPRSQAAIGHIPSTPSQLPMLAFNGNEDPQEPPANMGTARQFWPNSLELTVPSQGHDVDFIPWSNCGEVITSTFIQNASVAGLDTSCLASVPSVPFDLTLSALGTERYPT